MNSVITLELLGCSLLGQFIHLLIKANALKSRNDAAGLTGNPFSELISKDYINIILSFVANIALLVFFKNTTKTTFEFNFFGIDIQIDWRYFLFILSGYTGSSFVLSLLSKVDSLQKQKLNDVSVLTPNNMEYVWQLEFEEESDKVEWSGNALSLSEFAQATFGVLSGKMITYEAEPSFTSVTAIRIDTTTYLNSPVRKPK